MIGLIKKYKTDDRTRKQRELRKKKKIGLKGWREIRNKKRKERDRMKDDKTRR